MTTTERNDTDHDDTERIANWLVDNYLTTTLSGCVEEGIAQRDSIRAEVGDCSRCWRHIAECLASKVADLVERHELDNWNPITGFQSERG